LVAAQFSKMFDRTFRVRVTLRREKSATFRPPKRVFVTQRFSFRTRTFAATVKRVSDYVDAYRILGDVEIIRFVSFGRLETKTHQNEKRFRPVDLVIVVKRFGGKKRKRQIMIVS